MEQQERGEKKKKMNYRKIEFERFVRDIILGLFRYQSVSKHTGEKISKVFPINLLRVTIKVSMNVLKANRRELGRASTVNPAEFRSNLFMRDNPIIG